MKTSLFAGLMLLATSTANAALINIDFGPSSSATYTGQGILGTASDSTWNAVDFGGASNLTHADGTAGNVSVTTTFDNSFTNLPSYTNTLLADRLYGTDALQPQTITLTGLTANSAFDLILYNGFYAQTHSANGQSATTEPIAASSANNDFPNWTSGVEYATLSSAISDDSGQLVITVTPWDGITDFNPAQIQQSLQCRSSQFPYLQPYISLAQASWALPES